MNDFASHVESELYGKVVDLNAINFDYNICNFSAKHMKCKDKADVRNKEGCGRVFSH